jgi:ornithine cyclodeaminase/alanine dehydrogenase-like protein (mu-crystallin family)
MDCRWITAMRTVAASAVAAKFLAVNIPAVVGIIGAMVVPQIN